MEGKEKIKFRDLSIWAKIGIVGGYISIIAFAYGFLLGSFG